MHVNLLLQKKLKYLLMICHHRPVKVQTLLPFSSHFDLFTSPPVSPGLPHFPAFIHAVPSSSLSIFIWEHPLNPWRPCSNVIYIEASQADFFSASLHTESPGSFSIFLEENSASYGAVMFQPISPPNGQLFEDRNWISFISNAKCYTWHWDGPKSHLLKWNENNWYPVNKISA